MAINNMAIDLFVCTINGRQISDWGESATPFTSDPIDPKAVLRRGMGGRAVVLSRSNNGRRVQLSLNPASPDSAYMQGLLESQAIITMSTTQIGTLESSIATEGIIVNDGQLGRGGMTITDDVYIIEFNTFTQTKGGE